MASSEPVGFPPVLGRCTPSGVLHVGSAAREDGTANQDALAHMQVQPLRVAKTALAKSPPLSKMPAALSGGMPRPLSEVAPTSQRRNSPSFRQTTPNPQQKMALNDSPALQKSPQPELATSPRMFWQTRNSENSLDGRASDSSLAPHRRSSIERLQKASRVKNSNIYALEQRHEYDPTRVQPVDRPLSKVAASTNVFANSASSNGSARSWGHARSKSDMPTLLRSSTVSPMLDDENTRPTTPGTPGTPGRTGSPMKSSLSTTRFRGGYDPEVGAWMGDLDDDTKTAHRLAKSVTFDAAPPQVNEYEMVTPDISSIGSNSRDGSYDGSVVDEEEDDSVLYTPSNDHNNPDDSFDASLEDLSKTPVMGPDDWRHETREEFDSSPMPDMPVPHMNRPFHQRSNSATSSGEHRPLPPLPAEGIRTNSTSPAITGSDVGSPRSLPSPPANSSPRSEIIGTGKMTLEERLKLMMNSDDGKTAAELQRERRMRRGVPRSADKLNTPATEGESTHLEETMEVHDDDVHHDVNHDVVDDAHHDRLDNIHEDDVHEDDEEEEEDDEDDTLGEISGLGDFKMPPKISRESIMRRVDGNQVDEPASEIGITSSPNGPVRELLPAFDPDTALPSTEHDDSSVLDPEDISELDPEDEFTDDEDGSVIVRRSRGSHDEEDDISELLSDDDDYGTSYTETETETEAGTETDNDTSHYSDHAKGGHEELDDEITTPRQVSVHTFQQNILDSIADLELEEREGRRSWMLPAPPEAPEEFDEPPQARRSIGLDMAGVPSLAPPQPSTPTLHKPKYDGSGWGDPEEEGYTGYTTDPGTPESVIRHPMPDDSDLEDDDMALSPPQFPAALDADDEANRPSPSIPEQFATIKSASGSKLKTRPSATPSDIISMREARRQVSCEINVPPIPERHRNRMSRGDMETELSEHEHFLARHPSFRNKTLKLDLDLGLSLDQDFERVIEAQKVAFADYDLSPQELAFGASASSAGSSAGQASAEQMFQHGRPDIHDAGADSTPKQRGYLMRQNTKLVAASDKEDDYLWKSRSAGNSPSKKDRPQSWTVEPWNPRKKAIRSRTTPAPTGPVPPLPGQESNAAPLVAVTEDESTMMEVVPEDSGERGRLFVKVMGVKDLDLPLPKNERTWFSLTLDNGVHCVTTAWLELARNAPIGQEFELVVPNDLEFQLTLNVKLEKPTAPAPLPPSPTKAVRPKTSTFSRVFASPKKRKEMELRAREEEERMAQQQHRDALARQKSVVPTGWDLLSPLAAEDGSFARSYVCLKEHESRCFGRPYTAEVACFNEWATEEAGFASSVKSKRGNSGIVRRAPYKIGKLELQLLFVPRPKGSTDDDMPKSMNSCIREIRAAEERLSRNWEGHLSQQGGDCPYWRRRYFKLVGAKLTAFHEATRQPRATINLANAKRLIDDRQTLTEKETTGKNGRRRRSAFAEEEDGYMFVEEGFRIRFNNGECIDFYADTASDKEGWMRVLSEVIGRDVPLPTDDSDSIAPKSKGKWCELVLKREDTLRRRAEGRRVHSRTKSMYI